jgi:Rrf2 family protein
MTGFVYGKMSQHAVSAVSFLAEHHGDSTRLSSAQIAEGRSLPQPVVAKILTTLSAAGLISGIPGPSGGYALARNPDKITLADVVQHFEGAEESIPCPLGPGWCGTGPQCPIHNQIDELRQAADRLLGETHFGGFAKGREGI